MILDFTGVCHLMNSVRTIRIEYIFNRTCEGISYAKGKPSCACEDSSGKSSCASTCPLYQSAPSDIR